ncbi:MAG: glutaredoxin [Lachnospiraceae bacterium]|nr:glutaredoxin [Lachnospiraceae bacterium]
MKVILYGSHLCQDTLYDLMKVKEAGIRPVFENISVNFEAMKAFMKIRETDPLLAPLKEQNRLGIPLFEFEDGSRTLDWKEVVQKAENV